MKGVYYNENDPQAAQWLRNLINAGHIAPGEVDERSIEDVRPDELRSYAQCHFFAGIGIWSYSLRLAGWPDDRPVWTGSCPCQPFSPSGKREGFADERHLWPAWFHLIEHGKQPGVPVYGEQVANRHGLAWFDLVCADLEAAGYACRAVDLCAAGFGAPHIRQRLYFQACRSQSRMGKSRRARLQGQPGSGHERREPGWLEANAIGSAAAPSAVSWMADANGQGGRAGLRHREPGEERRHELADGSSADGQPSRPGPVNGRWEAADWLWCRDQRWRPVEPGTFPLVDGAASRVVRLRAYGNGIVPEVAAAFIRSTL